MSCVALDAEFIETKRRLRDTVDDHFEYKQSKIGEGTYGVVYKAKRKDRCVIVLRPRSAVTVVVWNAAVGSLLLVNIPIRP